MTMKPRNLLSLCLGMLLTAAPGRATTLRQMNLDELAASARVVARVRCLENESRAENGEIWTFTRFEVVEALKGSVPGEITVRLIGGRVGHLASVVDGVPRFRPGEEVFLFLQPTPTGDLSVTSWVQGTFRVGRDPATRKETVTQDTSSVAVFDPATRKFNPGGLHRLPVEQFRQRVAAAIERQARGRPE